MMRSGLSAFVILALSACPAAAQMVLTLADGATTRGSLDGIAQDGSFSWRGAGGPMSFPAARVVGVESGDAAAPAPEAGFRVELTSGDILIGRIEDGTADDVRLANPAFGDATIALDDIAAIWNLAVARAPESLPPHDGKAETLYVDREGRIDPFPGTLERIGKNQVVFSSGTIANRTFSFDRAPRVIAVRFAVTKTKRGEASSIVHLRDGSRLSGVLTPSDGASLAIKLVAGPSLVIDPRTIKSIAIRSDTVRYLSDLDGAEFSETPLFVGAVLQGLKRDRGLRSGQLLRIGRQTFTKGLLVPARGRVRFALDGTFARFAASVGADPVLDGRDLSGSAKAVVTVDGKPAWTSGILRSGQPPETLELPLAGARELVIEVDFADSFDAGARVVFGNAMLIR